MREREAGACVKCAKVISFLLSFCLSFLLPSLPSFFFCSFPFLSFSSYEDKASYAMSFYDACAQQDADRVAMLVI